MIFITQNIDIVKENEKIKQNKMKITHSKFDEKSKVKKLL